MSRLAQSNPAPALKRDGRMGSVTTEDGELLNTQMLDLSLRPSTDIEAEVCQVCKSSRYLNSTLRFLLNPTCYHKMCESCVDRIFSHGPAQCPIPGCVRTLRKHHFHEQRFEDIEVEREVDIRRKVGEVFNKREDEFESVKDYNDYLNEVEDITFNLVNGIDVAETKRRFSEYQAAHEKEIQENERLAKQEKLSFSAAQKVERQQARERREAARREEEQERREQEEHRRDMLQRLASGQDPDVVAKQGQQVQLKKRLDRQAAADRQRKLHAADEAVNGSSNIVIKGLKARPKPTEPEKPIDPFEGLRFANKYFTLQDEYMWDGIQEAMKDSRCMAGGYDIRDYTLRSLNAAFSGLGVFVADEMTDRDREKQNNGALETVRAGIGLKDSEMADAA